MTSLVRGLEPTKDCSCMACVKACLQMPGIFAPGEAEKAATLLGVPFEEFKKRLIKNYFRDPETDPLVWQPRKVGVESQGEVADDDYTNSAGRCTFLTMENRCEIHAAKPIECRATLRCGEKRTWAWPIVTELWKEAGDKI